MPSVTIQHEGRKFEFFAVEPNRFNRWQLSYWRNDTSCARPITDAKTGQQLNRNECKPTGGQVEAAVVEAIGRKLTGAELDQVFAIPLRN